MNIGIVFPVVVFIVAGAFLTWFVFGGYVTPGG
ncbi:YoaK family small membrane protein [Raoultella ornithinolytica]|nr:YoaK family small membrane protein [Raoultella ornithinolytica]MDC7940742.1 YoaK family small membrane protein [Raoultella ornithinolytica]MDV0588630.1 YoaK family small membrane protein [Raoultella ornithinolytica]HAT1559662.1 YoaK family small membrane protein [Raoultella ornithinolytica]